MSLSKLNKEFVDVVNKSKIGDCILLDERYGIVMNLGRQKCLLK